MGELHGVPESPSVSSNGHGAAAKHTPGPWKVDGVGLRALVRGDDLTIVAVRHRLPAGTHEANARLIAAAPDLLAAAKAIEHASAALIVKAVRTPEDGANLEGWTAAIGEMRAAIAKATASPMAALGPSTPGNSGTPTNTSTHTGDQPL